MSTLPEPDAHIGDLVPRPCASWQRDEAGRVVITRPKPLSQGWRWLRDMLAYLLSTPRIRLDDIGTTTWLHMQDGATVSEIGRRMHEQHPDGGEQLQQRLVLFLNQLYSQDLISYAEDPAASDT